MNAALGWAGLTTSAVGGVSYFMVLLRRPNWVRILNGSGLFCALALSKAPALRNLRAWDRAERRSSLLESRV